MADVKNLQDGMLFETVSYQEAKKEDQPKDSTKERILSFVEGPFSFCDQVNLNKRVYPSELWEKVLGDKDFQALIEKGIVHGEADHPENRDFTSVKEISHTMTKMWMDPQKKTVNGRFAILNTPSGRIIDTVYGAGFRLGVSTRALGEEEEIQENGRNSGNKRVKTDGFKLLAVDFVTNPSFVAAEPSIVKECVMPALSKLIESGQVVDDRVMKNLLAAIGADAKALREKIETKKEAIFEQADSDEDTQVFSRTFRGTNCSFFYKDAAWWYNSYDLEGRQIGTTEGPFDTRKAAEINAAGYAAQNVSVKEKSLKEMADELKSTTKELYDVKKAEKELREETKSFQETVGRRLEETAFKVNDSQYRVSMITGIAEEIRERYLGVQKKYQAVLDALKAADAGLDITIEHMEALSAQRTLLDLEYTSMKSVKEDLEFEVLKLQSMLKSPSVRRALEAAKSPEQVKEILEGAVTGKDVFPVDLALQAEVKESEDRTQRGRDLQKFVQGIY